MSRIKNLYKHLINNRRAEEEGWRKTYQELRDLTDRVSESLRQGRSRTDPTVFANTEFSSSANPWREFGRRLIYDDNGVTPIRRTTMGIEHFDALIADVTFSDALENLVKSPDFDSFKTFVNVWERIRKGAALSANYARMNRTLAACTCDVTSTVNWFEFDPVYQWLIDEGFIENHPDKSAGWHERNKQVMDYLRQEFAEELRANNAPDETRESSVEEQPARMKTTEVLLSMFVYRLFENRSNPFTLKKQVVLYGAPGTGKTFAAKRDTELRFSIWQERFDPDKTCRFEDHYEIVQFHPSFGYEDFIEGLRPVPDEERKVQLTLQNGIFKRFCRQASQWERDVHSIPNQGPGLAKKWESLLISHLLPYQDHLNGSHWKNILVGPEDGKIADAVPPYFFVIDEINRAELSRVMGELMYSLEYRGVKGAIATQYAALNDADTGFIASGGTYKFFIPHNVFLIGTMNTIDRSVESFDLALRRRFRWQRLVPDYSAIKYHLSENGQGDWLKLADNLETLNQRISKNELLGEDYEIGHAYLMNLKYPSDMSIEEVRKTVWEDSVSPLLEEYLRGSGRTKDLSEFRNSFGIV